MNVIIAGAGEVGFRVAKALCEEGHNVTIIEKGKDGLKKASSLDALVIEGNAASPAKLEEAKVEEVELALGLSGNDEVNMIFCSMVKRKARANDVWTVARVASTDYMDKPVMYGEFSKYGLDIDVVICPELVAAETAAQIISSTNFVDPALFANGMVRALEFYVTEKAEVAGKKLSETRLPDICNVCSILRGRQVIIPSGKDVLKAHDKVVVLYPDDDALAELEDAFSVRKLKPHDVTKKRILIFGGTRVGVHIARLLEMEKAHDVVLLDEDLQRAEEISDHFERTLVCQGDGTDPDVLFDLDITETHAFVATTSREATNVLSSMLAKRHGAMKSVCLIEQPELKLMLEQTDIDLAVSPKLAAINTVLRYTHRKDVKSLAVLHEGDAQLLEYVVPSSSPLVGKTVGKTNFPRGVLVGAIVRGDDVMIARGDVRFTEGDHLIVFAKSEVVSKLERVL